MTYSERKKSLSKYGQDRLEILEKSEVHTVEILADAFVDLYLGENLSYESIQEIELYFHNPKIYAAWVLFNDHRAGSFITWRNRCK